MPDFNDGVCLVAQIRIVQLPQLCIHGQYGGVFDKRLSHGRHFLIGGSKGFNIDPQHQQCLATYFRGEVCANEGGSPKGFD